jgi:hypothetical protein
MNYTEKSMMQHNISQLCSKSPDCSLTLELPIEMKIQKLQQKLGSMGYPLPEGKNGMYLDGKINKLFNSIDQGGNISYDTGLDSLSKYIPPYGGHTKNSLIRQEI